MYQNDEELVLFETIEKGRKSRLSPKLAGHFNQDKYKFYKRSFKGVRDFRTPSMEDMLHTASQKTQAIFKISSFGKGTKRIAAHLSYISRRGKLELEDQAGNKVLTLQDQNEKLEAWSIDFGDDKRTRNTMHIVLSTPPRTNPDIALKAAREFLGKEFKQSGHEYMFIQHTDTVHPHIHAVIKMMSCYGNKINPRKAYLRSVRQHFAAICRSYGIQVEASSRAERGLDGRSQKSEVLHMRKLKKNFVIDINLTDNIKVKQKISNDRSKLNNDQSQLRYNIIKKRYADKANQLRFKAMKVSDPREKQDCIRSANLLYKHYKRFHVKKENFLDI